MAKVNVWNRPPQGRLPQTKEFQDIDEETGEDKGEPISLTLWRLNASEESKAYENADALTARYVGDPISGAKAITTLAPVGGKVPVIIARMCLNAAVMALMQPTSVPEEDRYSEEEFLALMTTLAEITRREITLWINDVKKPKKKQESVSPKVETDTKTNSEPA